MSWNSLHPVDSSGGSDGRDFVKQAIAVLEAVPVNSDAALRVDAPAQTPEERALALVLRETLGVRTHE